MPLEPFKLERYFAKYEFSVKYLLCASDCEAMSIGNLLTLEPNATEKFTQTWLGYTESAGAPTLRQAISGLYTTIHADDVLVHSGDRKSVV